MTEKMITKTSALKKLISRRRYSLFIFGFLLVYSFIVPGELKPWREGAVVYAFHAVDYGMGFCSRFLPGAIYGALIGKYNETAMTVYELVLLVLFFLLVSLMLEGVLKRVKDKDRPYVAVLMFFLLTGPYALPIFARRLGMLDFYWALFCIPVVFCLSNRKLYFFAVPFFALLILTHYAAILNYVPLLLLMTLYKLACADEKKEKAALGAVFALSLAVSVGLTLYFVLHERENLVYPMDEFARLLISRGVDSREGLYYDYVLYRDVYDPELKQYFAEKYSFDVFGMTDGSAPSVVRQQIISSLGRIDLSDKIPQLLLSAPVAALLFSFVVTEIKKRDGHLKKLVLCCVPILFVVAFAGGCCFSTDANRWAAHALIGLFAFVLFVIHEEKGDPASYFREVFSRVPVRLLVLYMIIYCLKVAEPYESS
ncbi:MAG: hypothetical protein IJM45_10405 [Clostridia bacterium]|nr:hypothetical protein [Clostridia bacterium]